MRCAFVGCMEKAREHSDYCAVHSANDRCTFNGCNRLSEMRQDRCTKHKRNVCTVMGCREEAEYNGKMCKDHAMRFVGGEDLQFEDGSMIPADPSSQYKPKYGVWEHHKTKDQYEITGFGIDENTMQPVVIYTKITPISNEVWIRPCSQFFEHGRFVLVRYNTTRPPADDRPFTDGRIPNTQIILIICLAGVLLLTWMISIFIGVKL